MPGRGGLPIITQGHCPDSHLKLAGSKGFSTFAIQGSNPQLQFHIKIKAGKGLKQTPGLDRTPGTKK